MSRADHLAQALRLVLDLGLNSEGKIVPPPKRVPMPGTTIRIGLVDDHGIFRNALKSLAQATGRLTVCAEAATVAQATSVLESGPPLDVLILDLSLPDGSGLEVLRRSRQVRASLPVLILSMHTQAHDVVEAMESGARGYIPKLAGGPELLEAIEEVHAGRSYIHSSVAAHLPGRVRKDGPNLTLTQREQEALAGLVRGMSPGELAQSLCLSVNTVKTQLRSLYRKLGVTDRSQAIAEALRQGLIAPPA